MSSQIVNIGGIPVGDGTRCYIVAEIGINHNGSIELAKQLIDRASDSGCDAVKFQKRTIDVVYSENELSQPRESVFGETNGDLKRGLEFDYDAYAEIDRHCKTKNINWFASCWDEGSVDFMEQFDPPCYKIASASLTDDDLLRYHRRSKRPIILSTGMSTIDQIDHAINVLGMDDLVVLHCTSTYPAETIELNLGVISTLKNLYPIPIGYSGHESKFIPTFTAAMLGAVMIERHITVDRSLWGSDQAASLEPLAFARMVKYIREIEVMMGDGKKKVYDSELPIIDKLRRR
jgi:N-acetylneuraminate synthase